MPDTSRSQRRHGCAIRRLAAPGGLDRPAAVTLLDEPFAALDKASINFALELLKDAAHHPSRAWVIAHYEAPPDVPLAAIIDLEDR